MPVVELLQRREVERPGAVIQLIGAWDPVYYGYPWRSRAHIRGPNGPRGGTRAMCGARWQSHWTTADLTFPLPGDYRSTRRWNAACPECKEAFHA